MPNPVVWARDGREWHAVAWGLPVMVKRAGTGARLFTFYVDGRHEGAGWTLGAAKGLACKRAGEISIARNATSQPAPVEAIRAAKAKGEGIAQAMRLAASELFRLQRQIHSEDCDQSFAPGEGPADAHCEYCAAVTAWRNKHRELMDREGIKWGPADV